MSASYFSVNQPVSRRSVHGFQSDIMAVHQPTPRAPTFGGPTLLISFSYSNTLTLFRLVHQERLVHGNRITRESVTRPAQKRLVEGRFTDAGRFTDVVRPTNQPVASSPHGRLP